jgi:hypothetical protein
MFERLCLGLAAAVLTSGVVAVSAQVTLQPTPPPTVTAENEPWFHAREPIVFAGNLYYPGGPQLFFNRSEMMRTGFYRGIPLYVRTTLEPYSIVFVPLPGGLMQPYERRRTGELAGTVGSVTPSFPVGTPYRPAEDFTQYPQAAGPPTGLSSSLLTYRAGVTSMLGDFTTLPGATSTEPEAAVARQGVAEPPRHVVIGEKPEGLNGVYIEYSGRRWFSSGPAIPFDPRTMTRVGAYNGFDVYAIEGRNSQTIYVPVTKSIPALVAPYSLRQP